MQDKGYETVLLNISGKTTSSSSSSDEHALNVMVAAMRAIKRMIFLLHFFIALYG